MSTTPRHVKLARKAGMFKQLFDGTEGKQLLAELKQFCHLDETTLHLSKVTGQVDPLACMYNEGKRVVLLHMLKLAGLTYADIEHIRTMDEMEFIRNSANAPDFD
jgi:hypothetical protein